MTPNMPVALRLDADTLAEKLAAALGAVPAVTGVEPLAGDASSRNYFRMRLASDGDMPPSVMIMQLEAPESGPLDWLEIQNYLSRRKLPVPGVIHYEAEAGILVIEDLGDRTLAVALQSASPEECHDWYNKAVDLLADLQSAAVEAEGPAFGRRFDVEKLMWEMEFMLRHYVAGYLKHNPDPETRSQVIRELEALCGHLESLDPVFAHRDFHSRNLMVSGDHLVMIDFQDARLGPAVYDLASLLRDSYVTLDADFVNDKLRRFRLRRAEMAGLNYDEEDFRRDFDMMSIQRNLKAIGTFAFQTVERGSVRYEENITPTLSSVQRTLSGRPELGGLKEALQRLHPVFAS